MPASTRQDDEKLLTWIHLRCIGVRTADIAAKYGTSEEYVRAATRRVLHDDIAVSGKHVEKEYWDQKGGKKPNRVKLTF